MLKTGGCFMAGLATHRSAEPDTLVVRADVEEREWLIAEAPETYYLTDYYRSHAVVLARLSRIDRDALHDLLLMSWRLTLPKTRVRRTPNVRNRTVALRRSSGTLAVMSKRNGDRARFQKDRKRKLLHRQRIQALKAGLTKLAAEAASTRPPKL
jgi:hypothetical protein